MKTYPSLDGTTISDMPPNIIDNILSRLPIKEAVRTCVLSKKWKYNWTTLPELTFDASLGHSLINQNENLVRFIDGALSHHRGPICKFEISHLWIPNYADVIEPWIKCLSENFIQKLVLHLQRPPINHKLPSCLYLCEELNHLEVSFCTLTRPPLFATFKSLKCLLLYKVDHDGFTFENLISRCPLLEVLKVQGFTNPIDLILYAPKLQQLVISGFCNIEQKICFKNTPLLANVSLQLQCGGYNEVHGNPKTYEISNLMMVFGSFVGIEKLSLGSNFLKYFAWDMIPKKLPNTFSHLKKMDVEICFNDMQMISVGLCMIRSAPHLEELRVHAVTHTYTPTGFWQKRDGQDCSLNYLQTAVITSFDGYICQLEFVKFLLAITPALDKISIHGFKRRDTNGQLVPGSRILKELMKLSRASTKAQLEYFETGELVELGE